MRFSGNGEPKLVEITKGATVCALIKRVYFHDKTWDACTNEVAKQFSILKSETKKQYAELDDVARLDILFHYDETDLMEAMDAKTSRC